MNKNQLWTCISICVTVIAVVFIMARCDNKEAEETTKRQAIVHTNQVLKHENPILHP